MEIRQAQSQDIDRLLDLLSQVLEVHAKLRPDLFVSGTTKYSRDNLEEMLKDENKPIYVATIDNYVVGYAMCQIRIPTSNMYPNKIFHLDDICVDEKYRKNGIGKALYQKVVELAKENNCYEITLNVWPGNEAALKFYEKMGLKTRSIIMESIINNKE
jgi:ribosomal protein S18 acetylase RimI-like enzyme